MEVQQALLSCFLLLQRIRLDGAREPFEPSLAGRKQMGSPSCPSNTCSMGTHGRTLWPFVRETTGQEEPACHTSVFNQSLSRVH